MRRAASSVFLAVALLFAPSSVPGAGAPIPEELLGVSATLRRNAGSSTGVLSIEGRVAPGWHINSHKPSEDYLIPTAVRMDPDPSVTAGEPHYPAGKLVKFAFAEKPLSVYEEHVTVEVPLTFRDAVPRLLSGSVDF